MMETTDKIDFTFTIEKKIKEQFSDLCDEIGIPASAALGALVKQAVRQQRMEFSLADENGFMPDEAAKIKSRIADVRAGKAEEHSLIEA